MQPVAFGWYFSRGCGWLWLAIDAPVAQLSLAVCALATSALAVRLQYCSADAGQEEDQDTGMAPPMSSGTSTATEQLEHGPAAHQPLPPTPPRPPPAAAPHAASSAAAAAARCVTAAQSAARRTGGRTRLSAGACRRSGRQRVERRLRSSEQLCCCGWGLNSSTCVPVRLPSVGASCIACILVQPSSSCMPCCEDIKAHETTVLSRPWPA